MAVAETDRLAGVAALGGYDADDERAVATQADLAALVEQLGRQPRGVVGIAARCVCGRPLVVTTAPRLEDGTPFPTLFYLTHPALVGAVSTLEAVGTMRELSEWIEEDAETATAYRNAHLDYLRRRGALGKVAEIDGISAGGMPTRVKCLHVVVGHALAVGPGVNPVGDEAVRRIVTAGMWSPQRCWC